MHDCVDKNAALIALSERGRFWQLAFNDLSPAEQVFRAIWELEADVNNGGFHQYFSNSSGDTAFAVVEALKTIGARNMAAIASKACGVFPRAVPASDRAERTTQVDVLSAEQLKLLEELDGEFFNYPDNLTDLLYDFVQSSRADIVGI